ncbi:sulfurtransferase TusA family protein [Halomonas qinghailakensis]|uniref:Sulfurtransferase TusA family protein n=1 Tax=Halomonas qinghailakensis TaxID=2937790 RepID=A0AA46YP58_9GAMM|nr:sulfurtransferase TusA family protein [Halomonas sp. ZZQ-149]UYO73388.1 sulfurtransferase TusA family protein [Halomonas sp. ZZQ-149]
MSEQTDSRPVNSLQPDTVLDATGLHCPLPLLKAKQVLAGMAPGQRLEVRSTDAGSWRDMTSFTELSDHTLEGREQRGDIYYFWIRKAGISRS